MYDEDFLLAVTENGVFEQFAKRKKAFNGERGSGWVFPIYRKAEPQTTALSQTSDITPGTVADDSVTITITEYGYAFRRAVMVEVQAYTDTTRAFSRLTAINRAETMELIVRQAFTGGSRVWRPAAARTSLTRGTSTHLLTDDNLHNIKAMASIAMTPRMDDGSYAAIIPDELAASILVEAAFLTAAQYNLGNKNINLLTGEIGMLAGIRFFISPWAKVYVGGGTVAQAATTLSAAVAAGDTTCTVASATGIAAGDYIAVGTLETYTTEVVYVSAVSGTTLTITGLGNDEVSNTGFKYLHASGADVTEGQNVGALLLVGPEAVGKVYSSKTGIAGKSGVHAPDTVIPERFTDFWWWQIAGYGRIRNWGFVRGEFATPFDTLRFSEALL